MQVAAFSMFTMILVCIFWGAMATAFNIAFQDNTIRYVLRLKKQRLLQCLYSLEYSILE